MAEETKKAAKARIEAAFREHWPNAQANWQAPVREYMNIKDRDGNPIVRSTECVLVRGGPGASGYPLAAGHGATIAEAADKAIGNIPRRLEQKREREREHEHAGELLKKEAERARHVAAVLRNRCDCDDCKVVGNRLVDAAGAREA